MAPTTPLLFTLSLLLLSAPALSYKNVLGTDLQPCSGPGMARTGFMRDGHCSETQDDRGSHHICIDLSSTADSGGGNFCEVTGQPDWCSSQMSCHGDASTSCPVEHWCVCQWAFASYINKAGGCGAIQNVVCEATNMAAMAAYEGQAANSPGIAAALECLRERCDVSVSGRTAETE